MRTVDRGFDFYFNRAKNEAVVREPAGETLLVYRGCGNADDGRQTVGALVGPERAAPCYYER